jgi:hypothetical protein
VSLFSKLINGAKPEPETLSKLQTMFGLPANQQIALMVFETTFKGKVIYCCLSGGSIVDGEPKMTPIGNAAFEALCNLPMGDKNTIIFQELKIGKTPLKIKMREAIERAPAGARLCFIGDMQGELDGVVAQGLNIVAEQCNILH